MSVPDSNASKSAVSLVRDAPKQPDPVAAPPHYTRLSPEPIDVIQAWELWRNHYRACALKYISRAGAKGDELEDIRKAARYLALDIKRMENERGSE